MFLAPYVLIYFKNKEISFLGIHTSMQLKENEKLILFILEKSKSKSISSKKRISHSKSIFKKKKKKKNQIVDVRRFELPAFAQPVQCSTAELNTLHIHICFI